MLKSTYIETGGELPIFKPPPEERGSKRKVRESRIGMDSKPPFYIDCCLAPTPSPLTPTQGDPVGYVARLKTATKHKELFGHGYAPSRSTAGGSGVPVTRLRSGVGASDSVAPGSGSGFGLGLGAGGLDGPSVGMLSVESSVALGGTLVSLSLSDTADDLRAQCAVADDVLVLAQLDAGRVPEEFLRRAALSRHLMVTVDLSNYGMGDAYGVCLGQGLSALPNLASLRLRDNRLTSASVAPIVHALASTLVRTLDLSKNDLRGAAVAALGNFFKLEASTSLEVLDIAHCRLSPQESTAFFAALTVNKNHLRHLSVAGNQIGTRHAAAVAQFIGEEDRCVLRALDLSSTDVGQPGAAQIGNALVRNKTIVYLNMNACGINDAGAQQLAVALTKLPAGGRLVNETLQVLGLARNSIQGVGSFVLAHAITGHPSMRELDLSYNPVIHYRNPSHATTSPLTSLPRRWRPPHRVGGRGRCPRADAEDGRWPHPLHRAPARLLLRPRRRVAGLRQPGHGLPVRVGHVRALLRRGAV